MRHAHWGAVLGLAMACSDPADHPADEDAGTPDASTGGTSPASGGTPWASGGASAAGGLRMSGGITASGGARASGGAAATGGLAATGGVFGVGGTGTGGGSSTGGYSTAFDLTENPISESQHWSRASNAFTSVVTENGVAHGTNGPANAYDDSYALLSGFGPNQEAEAVIERSSMLATGTTHEVELLLRFSDDSGNARGYECLFAYFGGVQSMRWNGPMGSFTELPTSVSNSLGRELVTGDVIKANIIGTIISLYINGALMARATDTMFTTGQPGIGFFTRPGGNSLHLAITSYEARTLP